MEAKHTMTDSEVPIYFTVEGSSEYKEFVKRGVDARKQGDLSNWELGDLAAAVVAEAKKDKYYSAAEYADEKAARHYGGEVLKRYAAAIGVSYVALKEYRWVADRYEKVVRTTFSSLGWSHFSAVGAQSNREELLQRAQDGGWSVRALEDELARQAGKDTSEQRDFDRVISMADKNPYEALLVILQLLAEHEADRGVAATIESFNKEETLAQLRTSAAGRVARAANYLGQLYKEMKGS